MSGLAGAPPNLNSDLSIRCLQGACGLEAGGSEPLVLWSELANGFGLFAVFNPFDSEGFSFTLLRMVPQDQVLQVWVYQKKKNGCKYRGCTSEELFFVRLVYLEIQMFQEQVDTVQLEDVNGSWSMTNTSMH